MAAAQSSQPQSFLTYLRPVWSVPAAMRAVRATLVVPSLLALTFKVIGDPQMALYAVFGSFGALVMTTFGGSRRDKAISHLGLAVAGSISVIIGTLVSGSAWLAALVTLPVAFCVYFAGIAGPSFSAAVTAVLLAYVLPVASTGGAATIPSRLEGWWLAQAVSTIAVLTLSPRSPGDQLRRKAAALASALAQHLRHAVDGTATEADVAASMAAKHELMAFFSATPYRPTGLAVQDQALASIVSLLEWSTTLICEAMDGHLDLTHAAEEDKDLLAEAATALRATASLLDGGEERPSLERVWRARSASAAHLRRMTGAPAEMRRMADHAFHAQAIGVAVSAAAADALITSGKVDPQSVTAQRHRWLAEQDGMPIAGQGSNDMAVSAAADTVTRTSPLTRARQAIAADASIRSVWFRNAARGAVALAAAVAVAKLAPVHHAFWVVLGTLSVLRTSAGATGYTALRGLAGTAIGVVIGAGLLVGIGTDPAALWAALPLAVLVAAYTPGTAPFAAGQAAFTIVVVVLFNLLVPAGWVVGLLRVEDVAIGCAVSVVVGVLFWPRGASGLVGDNLADAMRAGAGYLHDAAAWALGLPTGPQGQAATALATGIRMDDAVRNYLTEQGSKRIAKRDLWALTMAALRLRLTAHSLASLPGLRASDDPAGHPLDNGVRQQLARESGALEAFYDRIAAQVDRPGTSAETTAQVPVPVLKTDAGPCPTGAAHYHPEALWVSDHLTHLASHSADIVGPASQLAAVRRRPWWR